MSSIPSLICVALFLSFDFGYVFFCFLLILWVVHAETLMTKGSLLPNKDYRFWPLRGTREDAWTRTVAFYPKKNKPPFDEFLWLDLLSVEPG